jgi:hypothetical protein
MVDRDLEGVTRSMRGEQAAASFQVAWAEVPSVLTGMGLHLRRDGKVGRSHRRDCKSPLLPWP